MARDSDSPPDVGETCGEARAWRGPRRWAHGARYQVGEHMRSWIKRFEGHGCERREGAHLPCRCRRGGKGWEEVDMRPRVQQRPGEGWGGTSVMVEGFSRKVQRWTGILSIVGTRTSHVFREEGYHVFHGVPSGLLELGDKERKGRQDGAHGKLRRF